MTGFEIRCTRPNCSFQAALVDGTVVIGVPASSFFNQRHELMTAGNSRSDIRCLCYERQSRRALESLRPGAVILDVGCGPTLPYERPPGGLLIGLDASFPSIAANREVDIRVCGTATSLPLPDASVDTILCFYSLHHMVGATVADTKRTVDSAFREFKRVLRSNGELLVFEVSPWLPVWMAQRVGWDFARRALGGRLDMYFWSAKELERLGSEVLEAASVGRDAYPSPLTTTFPPVFALPWLRIPRCLYPFDICLYSWRA